MNQKDLHDIFQDAIGKKVLQINAGSSSGSIFSIDIGNQLLDKEKNGHTFKEGEYVLMVYCSWRLFDTIRNKPITSWQEDSNFNGSMTLGLNTLLEDTIENVLITAFNDVVVKFKSGKVLSVFCDLTLNKEWDTNWFFRAKGRHYSVNNSLECVVE